MGKEQDPLVIFRELLNLFEDYTKSGFKTKYGNISLTKPRNKPLDKKKRSLTLQEIALKIKNCTQCDLCFNRLNTVPGEGVFDPLVMIIGEGPGADEDKTGRPFVGRAGQYLDKWLKAINLIRFKNCYIGNIVKCRPPGNRDPKAEEITACFPYLEEQIKLIRPKAILTLGRISSQIMIGMQKGINSLRGGAYFYKDIPLVPTFHPSAVLRDSTLRKAVWEDIKLLRSILKQ